MPQSDLDLAGLADIANALSLQGADVGVDTRVLEVYDSGEQLIEETANGENREVSRSGLVK